MAESQLVCMEDGHIGANVPETRPEFFYSEEQRAAVEELLRSGDGAFKTRLRENNMKDFLSAREVKVLFSSFRRYESAREEEAEGGGREPGAAAAAPGTGTGTGTGTGGGSVSPDSGVHSTYWPQMSDIEVPPLDLGWPGGAMFRGVTRVSVHTHPPKENGPHVKEVARKLIQEAGKVIAIVMDLLTDLHILQDLMDAACRRSVPVYILLDNQGVPHFLDMCSRLQIGSQHLRNIRTRTLQGVGFGLSFGRLPGSVCNKYMLIDGDKVMFGSYSFCWLTSRMDRNMITVMTGQVVDLFDQDFRELYAISAPLDLYKEFHVSPPAASTAAAALRSKVGPKPPPMSATTSRFQVSLGDSRKNKIEVPAHKYYNPKYALVFGDIPRPPGSLKEPGTMFTSKFPEELEVEKQRRTSSERIERLSPMSAEAPSEILKKAKGTSQEKKAKWSWRPKVFRKSSSKLSVDSVANSAANSACPSPTGTNPPDKDGEDLKVDFKLPKQKGKSNPAVDSESVSSHHQTKGKCKVS